MPDPVHAVLTGDVLRSGKLPPGALDRLFEVMEAAVADLAKWDPAPRTTPLSRVRGDGWQLGLGDPLYAVRAAFYIRARLTAVDRDFRTRIVIATGRFEPWDGADVARTGGELIRAAGTRLDRMRRRPWLDMLRAGDPDPALTSAAMALADGVSQRWTQAQARVLCHSLQPDAPDHATIAERMSPPVRQQAVTAHLVRAEFEAMEHLLRAIEQRDSFVK